MHLRKVYSEFINNIDDDYNKNLLKDSSTILLENLINTHKNIFEKSVLEVSSIFIDDDDKIL